MGMAISCCVEVRPDDITGGRTPPGTEDQDMGHIPIGLILLGLLNDPAAEAMRREAEAATRQRLEAFARIRALPAPAAPVQPARPVFVGRGILVEDLLEEPAEEDGAEEDKPKPPRPVISRRTFDRVVFGSTGDADSGRAYLERILSGKIRTVEQVCRLTPAQAKRLLLAGRGDLKRLFDRIEEERKEFERLRGDVDRCVDFLRELRPLQIALRQGPFEFGSIYAKTLRKMLDEGELARRVPAR
jgi:hypothetical protein